MANPYTYRPVPTSLLVAWLAAALVACGLSYSFARGRAASPVTAAARDSGGRLAEREFESSGAPGAAPRSRRPASAPVPIDPARIKYTPTDVFRNPASPEERQAMRRALDAMRPAAAQCLTQMPAHGRPAGGRIMLEVDVVDRGGAGVVDSAEPVESSFGNPLLDQCIITAISRARFARPSSPRVKFRYPLVIGQNQY